MIEFVITVSIIVVTSVVALWVDRLSEKVVGVTHASLLNKEID